MGLFDILFGKKSRSVMFVDIGDTLVKKEGDRFIPVHGELPRFLKSMRKRGIDVIGVTDMSSATAAERLKMAGVKPKLLRVIKSTEGVTGVQHETAEKVAKLKAAVIKKEMEDRGLKPGQVIMVGDELIDLQAARILGVEHAAAAPEALYKSYELNEQVGVKRYKEPKERLQMKHETRWSNKGWWHQKSVKRFVRRAAPKERPI